MHVCLLLATLSTDWLQSHQQTTSVSWFEHSLICQFWVCLVLDFALHPWSASFFLSFILLLLIASMYTFVHTRRRTLLAPPSDEVRELRTLRAFIDANVLLLLLLLLFLGLVASGSWASHLFFCWVTECWKLDKEESALQATLGRVNKWTSLATALDVFLVSRLHSKNTNQTRIAWQTQADKDEDKWNWNRN